MEHTITATEAVELIAAYTTSYTAAEPAMAIEGVNTFVAVMILQYAAAAADPGKYAYYPHPYTEGEAILHNAVKYLLTSDDAAKAAPVPVKIYTVPDEARADFAAFEAFLGAISD